MTSDAEVAGPIDPDVDLRVNAQRRELVRNHLPVLGVISLGGGLGALARYGISQLLPTAPGHFPWATFWTNVLGCFLIGVLMVLIIDVWPAHRLLRPFIGVGFLGGFTTFSTYAVEFHGLLRPGSVGIASGYLAGTLLGALLAVILGVWLTRWATRRPAGGDRE
ncbi:fluoride efflux transporter CrcB [Saccharopolyspora soli]|uniref:fluoride efflux transporter CrcB n=1 Tax=Saccharopolyspora soli TaxID=2926618 RepID=UPI0027DF91A0|nr:fluoride efflux transporter CrcB [Saccharopolyspora soli]